MNAPMMPITMSPMRPKPAPRTSLPASQPATRPTIRMTRRLSPERFIAIPPVRCASSPKKRDCARLVVYVRGCRIEAMRQLAAAVGRIAPGRTQQRHVIVPLRLRHGEADRHHIKKWRIGTRGFGLGIVVANREAQFVGSDRNRPPRNQRLVGAAVLVGDGTPDQAGFSRLRNLK